jgi:nucleoside-diphosphate-sugar epimerase
MRLLITGGTGVLGRALLSALSLPSGTYNVCRDGEPVSNELFTVAVGWHPQE